MTNPQNETWQILRLSDFSGGENKQLIPDMVANNQLLQALNTVITPEGLLETRLGKTLVNTTTLGDAKPIISLHRYAEEDGTDWLLVQHDKHLYAKEWNGASTITGNLASWTVVVDGTLSDSFPLQSVVWRGKIIFCDGNSAPFSWDGANVVTLSNAPSKGRYPAVYGGKLWMTDASEPNTLYFSGLEDETAWDALDIIKVRDGDGDTITGCAPLEGGMVITKTESVWALYGTSRDDITMSTAPLYDQAGCIAPRTLLKEGFFLGRNGFYTFNLQGVKKLPSTHDPYIDNTTQAQKAAAFACFVPDGKRVILRLHQDVINFDFNFGGATTWDTLNASCFCALQNAGDDGRLLIGDATNGLIYKLSNTENDAGIAIRTYIQHPYTDAGLAHEKVWRLFRPEIEPISNFQSYLYLIHNVDYGQVTGIEPTAYNLDTVLTWDTGHWDTSKWGAGRIRINESYWLHHARGRRVSFTMLALDRIRYVGATVKVRKAGVI